MTRTIWVPLLLLAACASPTSLTPKERAAYLDAYLFELDELGHDERAALIRSRRHEIGVTTIDDLHCLAIAEDRLFLREWSPVVGDDEDYQIYSTPETFAERPQTTFFTFRKGVLVSFGRRD